MQDEWLMLFSRQPESRSKINVEYFKPKGAVSSGSAVFITTETDLQAPIEELVNQTHINGDGFLTAVLNVPEGSEYGHFFVFVERDGDALYYVQPISEKL